MSASMCRCLRTSGKKWLRLSSQLGNKHKRAYCSEQYKQKTVPYFPDLERMRSLEAEYPDVEISAEDFKHVERLIPPATVPPVPQHDSFPTPSGWVPPNLELQPDSYTVSRSRYHQFPVYLEKFFSGRITTKLIHINGDIWQCNEDLKQFLEDQGYQELESRIQVHEVGRFIRLKGNYVEPVGKFLLTKGF